ncbi:MAG: [LysW]-aminoadipate/[LysW]-glutamate kinase [Candidatus Helarchaeales archaeon]
MNIVVIKMGGKLLAQEQDLSRVIDDIELLAKENKVVLTHGGGPQINDLLSRLGKEIVMVRSPSGMKSRFTDKETVEVATMVMGGLLNKTLVCKLNERGLKAVGLSGVDGSIIIAKKKDKILTIDEKTNRKRFLYGDYSGKISQINKELLITLLDHGYIPVISAIAESPEHELLNVDGDRAALNVAASLRADKLILLTDVQGVIMDEKVIRTIGKDDISVFMDKVEGGMRKKLFASKEALDLGLKEIVICSGLQDHPIINALEGKTGTSISWKHV